MSLHFILLFATTAFVASVIPGPSMLLALTHGLQHGAKKTVVSALGNVSVTLLQASISIAGLGAVLLASETVFQITKWAGTAYLIYMGIKLLRSPQMLIRQSDTKTSQSAKNMFLQSAIVTAGNPKAIIFFTAIFPQFISPNQNYTVQFCYLLTTCALMAFCSFMLYAICGQQLVSILNRPKAKKYLNKVFGGSFIGAGIFLASSHN